MLRIALAVLLLFPAPVPAQDLDAAVAAVVRISGMRGGTPVRGSGFVVGLDRDVATIVTAAHVIEGAQQLEVTFAAGLARSFPAGPVLGMEAGNPHGLAVFQARGSLPAGVTTLSFEIESPPRLRLKDAVLLLGFPQMELEPRRAWRELSARRGTLLLIDQDVGEGFSGGPVLRGGKVVGVITEVDEQTTYAVNAGAALVALDGWGAHLGGPACAPGEERTQKGVVFVRLCPGTFTMGSPGNDPRAEADERPAHLVMLSEFWIAKTEITNEQYRRFRPDHQGEAGLPVTGIRWADAKAACEHFGGRLPTEAEWEHAARAGSQTEWSFGDDAEKLGDHAWSVESSGGKPHPAGTKKPNPWGLHDLHGNVWEWVADWYGPYPRAAQTDPAGPPAGSFRVVRGGSFLDSARYLRSAARNRFRPEVRFKIIGFRCALAAPKP